VSKISLLTKGQIIGFDDAIAERPSTTSVKCLSSVAEVYQIPIEEFVQRMQRDKRIWASLKGENEDKDCKLADKVIAIAQDKFIYNQGIKAHEDEPE
jgi:CRP-like cAMP-binding protein